MASLDAEAEAARAGKGASLTVHRRPPRLWSRHRQRLGPAAESAVVRHAEIEIEQLEDGADQPFGLA
jgi:hypothetical protein